MFNSVIVFVADDLAGMDIIMGNSCCGRHLDSEVYIKNSTAPEWSVVMRNYSYRIAMKWQDVARPADVPSTLVKETSAMMCQQMVSYAMTILISLW